MSETSPVTRSNVASILRRASWFALQVMLVLVAFISFSIWAPWLGAQPMTEATSDIAQRLPPDCPAFTINHGHYACFEWGTADDAPWGPILGVSLTFACFLAAGWIAHTGRALSFRPFALRLVRPFALRLGDVWERINFGPKDRT